jgi:hypothetical protein
VWSLDFSQPYGPSRPVTGIALPLYWLGRDADHSSASHAKFKTIVEGFFFFGLSDYRHCGHSWPIVSASVDNEDDCGEHGGM